MLARITFFGPKTGGRTNPPCSGYRPLIQIDDVYTSCLVESTSGEEVFEFDREYLVSLKLFFDETYGGRLQIGGAVNLYEGKKQIGKGVVIDVEKDELG
jgi:hypothetical protein